jgi:ATP-dependent protease ClpP protease subunit
MEFPFALPQSTPTRIWDLEVPLVTNRFHTDAYILDSIEEPAVYSELCHKLRTAEKGDTFTIHLNTPGGMIDSAMMIIDAIKASKAKVTAQLTGTVASAGTIIALSCDQVAVADHTAFMIHNYSGGLSGKGHEMKARQEFIDSSLKAAFESFYQGFLTEKEMKDVIDGKDMWMGKDEVIERWSYKVGRTTREV